MTTWLDISQMKFRTIDGLSIHRILDSPHGFVGELTRVYPLESDVRQAPLASAERPVVASTMTRRSAGA